MAGRGTSLTQVESDIKPDILAYLNGQDETYAVKFPGSASGAKGTPDVLVCHRGRFIALEIKRPDGSYGVTKPQEIRMRQIRQAGGTAEAVASVSDVIALLSGKESE